MKRFAGRVVRLFFGCVLGLVLAEVGTRLFLGLIPTNGGDYVADADCGYRLRGAASDTVGFGYVNRFGFRDREPAVPKPPEVRRIVGIGDSFVLGEVAPRDNFLRVAERALADPADSLRTEIVMMGLGGYSPENYVGVLRSSGLACQPDLVLLCFYVGNDVIGIPTRSVVRRGELYPVSSANCGLDGLRRSWLFGLMEKQWSHRQRRLALRAMRRAPEDTSAGLSAFYLSVLRNRMATYARRPDARLTRLWSEAEGYLDQFDRIGRQAGVPWVLVLIPDEIQVDVKLRAEALTRLGFDPTALDFDAPQRRLRAWGDARGIPVLDFLPRLREGQAEGSFYLKGNTHWNESGNRVAGLALAEYLRRRSMERTAP